jgi:hypothetical protein
VRVALDNQRAVRNETVARHVGADHGSVVAAARIETARIIALARFGLYRLGMAQQDQTHGISIDLSRGV